MYRRCLLLWLTALLLWGCYFVGVSVLLFVNSNSSLNLPFGGGQGRTRNKPCFNHAGSNSSESGLSLEMFRRIANEGARLFEDFPDEDVVLCPMPGLPKEVWRGVQDLIQRRAWVRQMCRDNPVRLRLPVDKLAATYMIEPLNVNFCGNPKTGTTTWKSHLLHWLNYTTATMGVGEIHEETFHESMKVSSPEKAAYVKMHRPLSFFATRHPHVRLVSAYRDKILRGGASEAAPAAFKESLYRTTHGKTLREVLINGDDVSYDDELLFFGEKRNTLISFPEFVRYFIKRFNECGGLPSCLMPYHSHWWPMYVNCPPCDMEYDIMAKTESHDGDYAVMEHIMAASNLISQPSSSWNKGKKEQTVHGEAASVLRTNTTNNDPSKSFSICQIRECRLNPTISRDEMRENVTGYMRQLTPEETKHLNRIFHYDFLLFKYDPNEYS